MTDPQLIIIIGLPCSLKTTFAQKYVEKEYELFDDFMISFCDNKIIKLLKLHKKVCLTEPMLCNINQFKKYMYIFEQYINRNDILLILTICSVEQCLQNNIRRMLENPNKNVEYDIHKLSKVYIPDNYKLYNVHLINTQICSQNSIIIPI